MKKKRKVGFYYLTTDEDQNVQDLFLQVIDHLLNIDNISKKVSLNGDKFCFLESSTKYNNNTRFRIVFKSATHSSRPPLLDSQTISERENPKTLVEGERIKTHLVAKLINGDLVIILEKGKDILNIQQIVQYLNNFLRDENSGTNLRFGFETLVKDNFLEEIRLLNRVNTVDLIVDKQLLGSPALDFLNRSHSIQSEITLNIKANRGENISDLACDAFAKLNGGSNHIRRIRLVGRNHENNEVKINTDFIERQEFVNADYNTDTGEMVTNEMFIEMETILHNFN